MDEAEALVRLLHSYSPSGKEAAGVATFLEIARELGYRVHVDAAGNGIAQLGVGRPRICFLGHVDTVPGVLPVEADSDTVRGRGACDAKGALVSALFAGSRAKIPGEFSVIAAVGEETDSRGARWLARQPAPDLLIVGEPTGWAGLAIGYKGDLRVTFRCSTDRNHLSSPSRTAADLALEWMDRVRGRVREGQGPSPFRSLTAKVVAWASGGDRGLDQAVLTVDLRLPPSVDPSQLLTSLQPETGHGELTVDWSMAAVEMEKDNPVVRALVESIRGEGAQPTLYRKSGTSDLNVVWPAWRCPAAVYGPGDSHLDHTSAERVSIHELRQSIDVLARALGRLAGPAALVPPFAAPLGERTVGRSGPAAAFSRHPVGARASTIRGGFDGN